MRASLEGQVFRLALIAGAPAVVAVLLLELELQASMKIVVTTLCLIVIPYIWAAAAARELVVHQLRTLANLVSAIREGDYSMRGRGRARSDALGEVLGDLNALADVLREQRLSEMEASALLETVIKELDVAVLAFDPQGALILANRAAERLFAKVPPPELLEGEPRRRIVLSDGSGPFELVRTSFRQRGVEHQLVVLADVRRALREEERSAWQRLVRVLGHEINNSLAPIHSIADSSLRLMEANDRPQNWEESLSKGLAVIARRSEALSRFMRSYAQLARLPPPAYKTIDASALVRRVAQLEKRIEVIVRDEKPATLDADPDQLEQLMINLVHNAADAALETGGRVYAGWSDLGSEVELYVEDEGPGLPESANLFVPFFTTKPEGTGIGLVLSRQIAEAHGGTLSLSNAIGRAGCDARLRLPKFRT